MALVKIIRGLTPHRAEVLEHLEGRPLTALELAQKAHVSPSAARNMLTGLFALGMVRPRPVPRAEGKGRPFYRWELERQVALWLRLTREVFGGDQGEGKRPKVEQRPDRR